MNRYDRSPMEQAILERDRFQDEVNRLKKELVDEFARYKEALEKARVALERDREYVPITLGIDESLSTINNLLDKGDN